MPIRHETIFGQLVKTTHTLTQTFAGVQKSTPNYDGLSGGGGIDDERTQMTKQTNLHTFEVTRRRIQNTHACTRTRTHTQTMHILSAGVVRRNLSAQ